MISFRRYPQPLESSDNKAIVNLDNVGQETVDLVIYPGGGGTLGISGWGCAAGTLEPLTYTRASSAEFCYPILE